MVFKGKCNYINFSVIKCKRTYIHFLTVFSVFKKPVASKIRKLNVCSSYLSIHHNHSFKFLWANFLVLLLYTAQHQSLNPNPPEILHLNT